VAHGCWKTKKLIYGLERKNVVAYGRLSSHSRKGIVKCLPSEREIKNENN